MSLRMLIQFLVGSMGLVYLPIYIYIVVNFYIWFECITCITVNIPVPWIRNGNFWGKLLWTTLRYWPSGG